jgi:hypothetical protein
VSDIRRADPARTVHAGDAEVAGYLNPRPISAWIRVAFGGMSYRLEVRGFHVRRFGIRPDPVKA